MSGMHPLRLATIAEHPLRLVGIVGVIGLVVVIVMATIWWRTHRT
jgi:hypothetical protein